MAEQMELQMCSTPGGSRIGIGKSTNGDVVIVLIRPVKPDENITKTKEATVFEKDGNMITQIRLSSVATDYLMANLRSFLRTDGGR